MDTDQPLSPELSAKVARLFGDQAHAASQLLLERLDLILAENDETKGFSWFLPNPPPEGVKR